MNVLGNPDFYDVVNVYGGRWEPVLKAGVCLPTESVHLQTMIVLKYILYLNSLTKLLLNFNQVISHSTLVLLFLNSFIDCIQEYSVDTEAGKLRMRSCGGIDRRTFLNTLIPDTDNHA